MIPPGTPSSIWTDRYETLRRHVSPGGRVLDGEPLSLGLWVAQGMAGWMRRWSKAVAVAPPSAAPPPPVRLAATSLWQQQLTLLLAQITVQRLYPAPRL